jgi:peptidoglycan hydrolase-like protein with peptidoglycan-binding domain
MRKTTIATVLAACLTIAAPASAETDLGTILSGIAQSLLAQEADRNAYIEAQRLNTVSAYRNYLATFPKGAFRVNAEQALRKLGATVDPGKPAPTGSAASVEAAIGLSRTQRVQIQKQLTSIGYSTGVADGLWGGNTRRAITQWQTANKLTATGYVTLPQVRLIAQQAGSAVGTDPGGTTAADDQVEEHLLGLTYQERLEVQRWLTLLGFNTWGIDGAFGPNTRRSLASWQRSQRLRASGYLTADQFRALRRQAGG